MSATTDHPDGPRALAIDIGTSSVKALVVDAAGRTRGPTVRVAHPAGAVRDNGGVFDPAALLRTVTATLDRLGDEPVDCVGVSCFWHSLLGLDGDGEPVTDVLTWAFTSAEPFADALAREQDPAAVHARTGAFPHASYWPAKLRWLAATQADAYRRVRRWADTTDWLFSRLFARTPQTSVSMASGTGLLDLRSCTWDRPLCDALGVSADRLPVLRDEPWHGLAGAYAARWPALAGVPWAPAFGDGACSNVGAGAVGHDRAALNVGTSGAMRVLWETDEVAVPPDLWCYRADRRRLVAGGALSNGGNLHAWMRRTLRLPDDAETQLAARPAAGHGLAMLPLLAGERAPGYAETATGVLAGLRLSTDAVDVLRAGLESVALTFRAVWDALRRSYPGIATIVATGGGIRESAAWRQIIADGLDHPLVVSDEPEGSARGAALLALEAGGFAVDLRAARTGPVVTPDPAAAAALAKAAPRQRWLYDRLVAPDAG